MTQNLAYLSAVLSVIGMLMTGAIVLQRRRAARIAADRGVRLATLKPVALTIADSGDAPETLASEDLEVLSDLVGRYAGVLNGSSRAHLTSFFANAGFVDANVRALRSSRPWRRAAACSALGNMGASGMIPLLRRALQDQDEDVRAAAVGALGSLGAFEALGDITQAVLNGSVPRSMAATALLGTGSAALPSLRILAADANPPIRAMALELMGHVGSGRQTSFVMAYLNDDRPEVRRAAAVALGRLADREAAAALRHSLIDPATEVRAAAAQALGRIGDPSFIDDLVHLASHDDFDVAHAAATALATLSPTRVADSGGTIRAPALREAADLMAIGAA